ncbi:MAG: DGQHR domain-containing protein [Terriglobales bacterium]
MPEDRWITFPCIAIVQPIGSFYIGVMNGADLVRISFADRVRIENDAREVEVVSGLERPLQQRRVKELRQFVRNVDASFPTAIILALSSEDAMYDEAAGKIKVRDDGNVAKIIDGQHRIEGLIGYEGDNFQLNVTLFIDMDMEDQAMVFSTINLKQTPVRQSIALELFEYAKTRSPQKTSHNIARLLNAREGSPFYKKIMILGTATGRATESLTQAAFIKPLMRYISTDPMSDRDQLKRGKTLEPADPAEIRVKKVVFRNLFIEERDAEIARIMWNYFKAVEQRWPEAWTLTQEGLVLNRTTGYNALMKFLPLAYLTLGRDTVIPTAEFKAIFDQVKLRYDEFIPDNFKPGSGGQSQLFKKFMSDTKIDEHAIWKGITEPDLFA